MHVPGGLPLEGWPPVRVCIRFLSRRKSLTAFQSETQSAFKHRIHLFFKHRAGIYSPLKCPDFSLGLKMKALQKHSCETIFKEISSL